MDLLKSERYAEVKTLVRKTMPAARRVLGKSHEYTLKLRWNYARALCADPDATLDDLRESVTTLGDLERTTRRVFGGAHPNTAGIGRDLQNARAALRVRESPLPWPWEAHRDDAGRPYYHNRETGESVWTLPDELLARETPSP